MPPQTVLVTGASSGIGLATALSLAESGFVVYASLRDLRRGDQLKQEAQQRGLTVHLVRLDATEPESIRDAVDTIVSRSGGIYALVNNAGIIVRGYFEDVDEEEIRRVCDTNLFGSMAVTRAVLPHMRDAGEGRVVFISSTAGRLASPGNSAYCVSKFALEGFGECLRQEVEPFGIFVSLVEPGFVKTELFGRNRNVSRRAEDPSSPYHSSFQRLEQLTDREVRGAVIAPSAVGAVVRDILTTRRPKMRYLVGRRPKLLFALRRYLPGETFDRIWMRELGRRLRSGPKPEGA